MSCSNDMKPLGPIKCREVPTDADVIRVMEEQVKSLYSRNMKMKSFGNPTKIIVETSHPDLRIEVIQGRKIPELNIIHDQADGTRTVAMVGTIQRLRQLKAILKDV